MLIRMRTTLNLRDDLVIRAKHLAIERQTTLSAIIEQALRELLAFQDAVDEVDLPSVDGGGFPEGYPFGGSEGKILSFLESLHEPVRR